MAAHSPRRNRLVDRRRREGRLRLASALDLELLAASSASGAVAPAAGDPFPDERLDLMFVCAHPAIEASVHTPLMLQTVLALDAAAIARGFLASSAAMRQRLVRAKAKIRDAGIAFEVPDERELPERLEAVLEAIYCAYESGWERRLPSMRSGRRSRWTRKDGATIDLLSTTVEQVSEAARRRERSVFQIDLTDLQRAESAVRDTPRLERLRQRGSG